MPPDEIFDLNRAFAHDDNPQKVNLTLGAYRTDNSQPWPLPVVQEAEKGLLAKADIFRHEYTSIEGDAAFLQRARDLLFGFSNNSSRNEKQDATKARISSVQTVAGTGANHLGALFLAKHLKPRAVWLSDPSWDNHQRIWELVGVPRKTYPYYSAATHSLDFAGMMATLEAEAHEHDVVLLQACGHNPTGVDLSQEQWKALAELMESKRLFPFFDSAYQGLASGSTYKDTWPIRHFLSKKPIMDFCVAQSLSKNFGLYGQRVGALHYVLGHETPNNPGIIGNNLCHLIRSEYSVAPRGGSNIVKEILSAPGLSAKWHGNVRTMNQRLTSMREALYEALVKHAAPGLWTHIIEQRGMFSYTGLSPTQIDVLRTKYHIYMLQSGRISISGLSGKNVAYVAKAIDNVVRSC
ncbi:aspartate transaminase, cytoplasmic [Aspergillus homomorphus CBS 101889]|uniref:Aspartate aminotransferase n=1 Tax=Aspergillus homomorphus (strain CBS 101889) TaxID=1450537 RepID=A0A395HLP6_ASPHC|nr:aspartate transaminase, cytoplasmic [Aspergillus homomorphus CBS 101889]RAL08526.1 aspartate transaminase, cytoplasmic [Aspergillus homomorphus CBS 101889]